MVKKIRQLDETADALHSAALRLLRRARAVDVQMDLDGPRASALSVLVFGGPIAIGALARAEQVSAPAITKTVAALEADGLAARIRSTSDRRVVTVQATAKGRALLEQGRAARVQVIADLLAESSERDRATLRRAAHLITQALAREARPMTPAQPRASGSAAPSCSNPSRTTARRRPATSPVSAAR